MLRDIPLPSWKLVFPDKLLQFRPLDGLRADLFTVAGACAHSSLRFYLSVCQERLTQGCYHACTLLLAREVMARHTWGPNTQADTLEVMVQPADTQDACYRDFLSLSA